ncbi:MAG TPA: 50S ribosomal protein L25 [Methylomirabilota bacterium]|nr:50S ribosomal protein L25 [Methylomirabilota bacterium]
MATTIETSDIVLTVSKRDDRGTSSSGRLRAQGRVPAVLYGGDKPPVPISVEETAVREILKQESGENTIFLLKLEGTKEERQAMIKELQADPISGKFVHIDFIRVMAGHALNVPIRIDLRGDCAGVRHGGRVDFVSRELAVEVLPRHMFDHIEIDMTNMEIGDVITVADLEDRLPESGRFLEDPSRVVVLVEAPRAVALPEDEEAAGGMVIEESAEPEVIGKAKEEAAGE